MTDTLDDYRAGKGTVPQTMLGWPLYGTTMDDFGRDHRPVELPVPAHGPDQLLARVDAAGLCFSDIKILTLGSEHPRLAGRDLATDPVVMGHEVALTVIEVGEDLGDQFRPGDRFVIQADIYYQGQGLAFGYALPGALEQYVAIGKEILQGDEGSYLLPVQPDTGYSEAALSEPWACVECAYGARQRNGLKPGGTVLVAALAGAACDHVELGAALADGPAPEAIVLCRLGGDLLTAWRDAADKWGAACHVIECGESCDFAALAEQYTPGGFDDIIALDAEAMALCALVPCLAKGGHLAIIASRPLRDPVAVDVGRIHYDDQHYIGTAGNIIAEAYDWLRSAEPVAGGRALFIGAAGPMGQMHLQRAIESASRPAVVVATDVDDNRLATIPERLGTVAEAWEVELICLNPVSMGQEAYEERLEEIAPDGFDDVVLLAPVPALASAAMGHLADGGVLNLFAGLARGTIADLDLSPVYLRGARLVGTSGSSIDDLRGTLGKTEAGELSPDRAVAAIGGMPAAWEGLRAVKEGDFAGKVVIYPQLLDMELTPLEELSEALPTVAERLEPGGFWNKEAEAELLRGKLGEEPAARPRLQRLSGKAALVTGGSQGLGRALADRLAAEGASVAICDINGEGAQTAAQEIGQAGGRGAIGVGADVTKLDEMQAAVSATVEAFGKLDILVSNAGILIAGALEDFEVDDWRKVIEVNLVGYFVAAKAAAPALIKTKGCIVQINSKSGKKGSFKNSAYAAGKFGGIGLTQSLALELAPLGVRVNSVCPGNLLDSPLWVDSLYAQYAQRWGISEEEVRKKYEQQVPLGRGCSYEDVADVAVFLASDEASYMTGQAINVTGGQEMR